MAKKEDLLSNFIPLNRDFFEHPFWSEKRIYSKAEAWIYLIKEARFEDSQVLDGGVLVEVKRGQLYNSMRFYSIAWGWSTKKVGNFLFLLENLKMIKKETLKETGQTMVTLSNYDKYNAYSSDKETLKETRRKREGNAKETKSNTVNKENTVNKDINVDLVYQAYPAKCIIRGASTGKGVKNKETIKSLIKTIPAERLVEKIKKYVEDCRRHNVYMKNFATFLNNIPDDDQNSMMEGNNPQLGVGEYMDSGKRYYGAGRHEVPMDMPPRPGDKYYLNIVAKQWNV